MNIDSKNNRQLYFVAIVPDEDISGIVTAIKKDFKNHYQSKAALKSPPHITLIPPFNSGIANQPELIKALDLFCKGKYSFQIDLSNYGCFAPRVIYIQILNSTHLKCFQSEMVKFFKEYPEFELPKKGGVRFSPHMTVAFRDLTKEMFYKAWDTYKNKQISITFRCNKCSLLKHNGKSWDIVHEARFN